MMFTLSLALFALLGLTGESLATRRHPRRKSVFFHVKTVVLESNFNLSFPTIIEN